MASVQDTELSGVLKTLLTTEDTSSASNLWYDSGANKFYFSANSGSSIIIKEVGNAVATESDLPPPPSYNLGLTPALISVSAQNNSIWTQRTTNISAYLGATARLVIGYQAGNNFTADVQFDDFNIGGNIFDPQNGTNNFETTSTTGTSTPSTYSSVSWTALLDGTSGQKFHRDASGTGSSGTGNTSGFTGTYYYYAETSGSYNQYYWLRSPIVTLNTSTLSFYSAQNGDACGPFEAYLDIIS